MKDDLDWREHDVDGDAKILQFKQNIWFYEVDPGRNILYLVNHKGTDQKPHRKGILRAIDLNEGKELWDLPYNPKTHHFILIDSIPIVFSDYYSRAYDCNTGQEIYSCKGQFVGHTEGMDLGIVYYPKFKSHSHIFGVNYGTGEKIWAKMIPHEHEPGKVQLIGDTAWVAEVEGIDYTQVWTGEGWHHKVKTRASGGNPSVIAMGVLFGGVFGGVIAAGLTSSTGNELRTGSSQRTWDIEEQAIYCTGTKSVYKLNQRGQVQWKAFFEKSLTGTNKLFRHNKDVYVVHNGMLIAADGYTKFGKSGIEQFGYKNGFGKAHRYFDETIRDYLVKDSTVMIALDTKIVELRLSDLSIYKEKVFATAQGVKIGFKEIMNPPGFIKKDSLYLNTTIQNPNYFYASNKAGMKIEFDEDFEMTRVIRRDDYFFLYRSLPNTRIVENENGLIWLNLEGKKKIGLVFSHEMKYFSDFICDRVENKILIYSRNSL